MDKEKSKNEVWYWIKCVPCGNYTHPDLIDCNCEQCGACDWERTDEAGGGRVKNG